MDNRWISADNRQIIITVSFLCLSFTLTSSAYIAWVYHLTSLAAPGTSDYITLVAGYLMQAAGIGLVAWLLKTKKDSVSAATWMVFIMHLVFLFPALLSHRVMGVILWGLMLNLTSGCISALYIYRFVLARKGKCSGLILGLGYSLSILLSWFLSVISGSALSYTELSLVICIALTAGVTVLYYIDQDRNDAAAVENDSSGSPYNMHWFFGLLILLFSVINSCGYAFPSADFAQGIRIESSRLFYAGGLLIAGCVSDRERKYGALAAMTALVIPFVLYAMQGRGLPLLGFWALSYFGFGFFTMYRLLLFADIASEEGFIYLSGFGLLFGRIGDAMGEMMTLVLSDHFLLLLLVSLGLFIVAVLLFFRQYLEVYLPKPMPQYIIEDEHVFFNRFSAEYSLSAREREVLRFLLDEKSNAEIAEELSLSESTVKFHIHNLLKKTGENNRISLISSYFSRKDLH